MGNIDILSLTSFDVLIFFIVFVSSVFGVYRGFLSSTISFIGWILSLYLGIELGPIFAPLFSDAAASEAMASVFGVGSVFLFVAILMALLNHVLNKWILVHARGLLDRSFGLVFGFLRGCLVVSILFYVLTMVMPNLNVGDEDKLKDKDAKVPEWIKKSETIILLKRGADLLNLFVPQTFENELNQSIVESTNEKGEVELPSTRAEKIRSLNKLLNSLPDTIIERTSDNDLITLQDMTAPPELKAQILEKIAHEYYQYNHQKMVDGDNPVEIEKNNRKYHNLMMMVENEILKYRMQARSEEEKQNNNGEN